MKILTYPAPELRLKATPVTKEMRESQEFKDKLVEFIELAKQDGIGLASIQTGWGLALFVALVDKNLEKCEPQVFINPQITGASKQTAKAVEGCLSVSGFEAAISRPEEVSWEWENLEGEKFSAIERFTKDSKPGYYIRMVQHECDHLNGVLFPDHLSAVGRLKFEAWLKSKK